MDFEVSHFEKKNLDQSFEVSELINISLQFSVPKNKKEYLSDATSVILPVCENMKIAKVSCTKQYFYNDTL